MTEQLPTERSFGISVGVASVAMAAMVWWGGQAGVAATLATVGLLLTAMGLITPAMLRVPNRLWSHVARALGWINVRVILTAVFVVVLTPAGVFMRLFGRSPLTAAERGSNWHPYSARRRDPTHYDHLF